MIKQSKETIQPLKVKFSTGPCIFIQEILLTAIDSRVTIVGLEK